jgi:hypothetical protein
MNENKQLPDGTWVETSFGRTDFEPEYEDRAKRKYTDKTSLKANGIDAATFRLWARNNDIAIPSRGRIPVGIVWVYLNDHS